ncbi:MAG: ATP-binding protein [Nitrospirae bacterium]|nr:ATP-binding protein [Nitrospirota bacterium]
MLIEFSVTNFRSIREKQTLSMVAGSGKEMPGNTFDPKAPKAPRLLRSAALFGPNASGKTNVINALAFMHNFVRDSATGREPKAKTGATPFLLDRDSRNQPSEFEILFIHKGIHYQYGFALTRERVVEEWLFAWPVGRAQMWFKRSYDDASDAYTWGMGNSLLGQRQVIQEATRPNALFVSTAAQLNHEQLSVIPEWFQEGLFLMGNGLLEYRHIAHTLDMIENEGGASGLANFMKAADLGINGIAVDRKTITADDLPSAPEELKQEIVGKKMRRPVFLHECPDGSGQERFPIESESDGTRAMFALAGPWRDIIANGMVLVIDELSSLHPKLVRFLVELIHSPHYNPKNAQLIFTTHDVTLMDDLFRRDQIWLVEKDASQASTLTPLSEFKPRLDEKLQKGYMSGRYGALPVLTPERL